MCQSIGLQCVSLQGGRQKETQKKQLNNIHENHIEKFIENKGTENRAIFVLGAN